MPVTAPAAPGVSRHCALTQLTLTELRLFTWGRARVALALSIGVPLLMVIIFGGIRSFKTPVAAFGGLTTLDVYIPILLVFAVALLALVSLPASQAGYRELGYLRRLRHISHATPLGAAVPALQNATLGQWPTWLQLLTMGAYAAGFSLAAARFFRWE